MVTSVGIDLGGTKLLAVRLEDGEVVARERFATPGEDFMASAVAAIRALWTDDVAAVGAGIAGLVATGTLDLARIAFSDAAAYGFVFGLEAVLFLAAALVALRLLKPAPILQPGE